ncbi:MAG: GlsB/YeaQ/YmgE family stress response membrane protein [Acidobacteriota bacterium]
MTGLIYALIVGGIAGWLAGLAWKGGGFGVLANIAIGIVGGLIGGFVFGLLGLQSAGLLGSIVTSFVGAILLLWIVKQLKK